MASLTPRLDRLDKNYIINGNLDFWQRVVGATTTVNTASTVNAYTADRFNHYSVGATVKNYSLLRTTSVPTFGQSGFASAYGKRFNCLTAISSPASGDLVAHNRYKMEGQDYAEIYGKKSTLSFWVRSNKTGTFPVAFKTYASDGATVSKSYITTFAISVADTWEKKIISVQMDSSTTPHLAGLIGMSFSLAAGAVGSTFLAGSLNTWLSGDFYSVSGLANIMDSNTNYMEFAQVALYASDVPDPQFVRCGRNILEELALCQRYYEKSYDVNVNPGTVLNTSSDYGGIRLYAVAGASGLIMSGSFKITKRARPTFTTFDTAGNSGKVYANTDNVTPLSVGASQYGWMVQQNSVVSSQVDLISAWIADSEL